MRRVVINILPLNFIQVAATFYISKKYYNIISHCHDFILIMVVIQIARNNGTQTIEQLKK